MLALLALALFPVAAQAECTTSSCATYETEVPGIKNEAPPKKSLKESPLNQGHSSGNHKEAHGSAVEETETGESTEPEEETGTESEGEGHKKSGAAGPSGGGNGNPPKNGGEGGNKPSNNGGGSPESGVSESKSLGGTQSGKPVSESSSSSPVVPILIAVVVLAAISIGVVLYRQRKSGQGPDGRAGVSSSNAS